MLHKQKKLPLTFWFLLGLDSLVLLLHVALSGYTKFFHLDHEQNFPTFYQGFKLVFFGVLGILLLLPQFRKKLTLPKSFIFGIALLLIAIGIDEMFQFHENIYRLFELNPWLHPSNVVSFSESLGFRSSLWLLYYSPVLVAVMLWLGYWLRALQSTSVAKFRLLLLSLVCFFVVICMEVISSTGDFWHWQYQILIFFEEGAEILAGTFLAAFLLQEAHTSQSS